MTSAGSCDIPPHTPYPPDRHPNTYMFDWKRGRVLPEYAILYITRGEGFFETKAGGKKTIREGDVFLLFPGVWHSYAPNPKSGWKEYWVCFNGAQPRQFLEHNILSPDSPTLNLGHSEVLVQLYQQIIDWLESGAIACKENAAALTYQIIAHIHTSRLGKQFSDKSIERILQKAKTQMIENLDKPWDLKLLSEELGVGYSWFRRMFQQYTGLSPNQYLLQLKMNKAKFLLRETSLSVKEISALVGFGSQYYFSKYFRKKVGVSPVKWRQFSRGELEAMPPGVVGRHV